MCVDVDCCVDPVFRLCCHNLLYLRSQVTDGATRQVRRSLALHRVGRHSKGMGGGRSSVFRGAER